MKTTYELLDSISEGERALYFGPFATMQPYYEHHEIEMMQSDWAKSTPSVDKVQRESFWKNFKQIHRRFKELLETDRETDPLELLREAIWEVRRDTITGRPRVRVMADGKETIVIWKSAPDELLASFNVSKESTFGYREYKQLCVDHPDVFVQWDLDTHHDEVNAFAPELGDMLYESAQSAGKTPPMQRWQWDAMTAVFSVHDELKWCGDPKAQFAFDHKHMMAFLFKDCGDLLRNRTISIPNAGGSTKELLLTDEVLQYMQDVAENHENINKEREQSRLIRQPGSFGETLGEVFIIDTLTGAFKIIKKETEDGSQNVVRGEAKQAFVLELIDGETTFEGLNRYLDLLMRHLNLGTDDKRWVKGKATLVWWVLHSCADVVHQLRSWQENWGVEVSDKIYEKFFLRVLQVMGQANTVLRTTNVQQEISHDLSLDIAKASLLLDQMATEISAGNFDIDHILEDRAKFLGEMREADYRALSTEVFYSASTRMMRDTSFLIKCAGVIEEEFARQADTEDSRTSRLKGSIFAMDVKHTIFNDGDEIPPVLDTFRNDQDADNILCAEYAQNSVGFLSVLQLAEYEVVSTNGDPATSDLRGLLGRIISRESRIEDLGSRISHDLWYVSQLFLGKERRSNVEVYDKTSQEGRSRDWLQVRTAGSFILAQFDAGQPITLNQLRELYKDKEKMLECALACRNAYFETYMVGESPKISDEEMRGHLPMLLERGVVPGGISQHARVDFARNNTAIAAAIECMLMLAREQQVSPFDILADFASGKISPATRHQLATWQKINFMLIKTYLGEESTVGWDKESETIDNALMNLAMKLVAEYIINHGAKERIDDSQHQG